ncbi:MAG: ribosome-associated translation inhibitor RaiA [Candidatus Paceibacterota bacterium]|jgi:ribosomal subunit interface protein
MTKINTKIKATDITLTPEISDYLDKRLSALEKFVDAEDDANICFVELARTTSHHKAGDIFKAELTLHLGGQSFRAVSEMADLHSAIDKVKDELLQELRGNKTKQISLIRRSGRQIKNLIKGISNWRPNKK